MVVNGLLLHENRHAPAGKGSAAAGQSMPTQRRDVQPFGIPHPFSVLHASDSPSSPVDAKQAAALGSHATASRLRPDSPVLRYQNLSQQAQEEPHSRTDPHDGTVIEIDPNWNVGAGGAPTRISEILERLRQLVFGKTGSARYAIDNGMIPKAVTSLQSALDDVDDSISDLQGERAQDPDNASAYSHAIDLARGEESIVEGQMTETRNSENARKNRPDMEKVIRNQRDNGDAVEAVIEQLLKEAASLLDAAENGARPRPGTHITVTGDSPASKIHNVFQALALLNRAEGYLMLKDALGAIDIAGQQHAPGGGDIRRQIEQMRLSGEILVTTLPSAETAARRRAPAIMHP